jgi:sulfatase modifying factor 1
MGHFSGSRRGLLTAGGSATRVLYDAAGNANYMVAIPRFNLNQIDPTWPATPHPAFIVNGATKDRIWIGKYQAAAIAGKAVSQPGLIPWININFANSLAACAAMGPGWHLMTNTEWAAVALWCWKAGFQPRGNTNWGLSSDLTSEGGVRGDGLTNGTASGDGKTYSGSGPIGWNHDRKSDGIADLCGNVWEWVGGLRTNGGEINVLADNNAADNTKDQAVGSAEWKAILADGSLVAPGTASALKYDGTAADGTGTAQIDDTIDYQSGGTGYTSNTFANTQADLTVPPVLKYLALFPVAASGLGGDYLYTRNVGERLPFRGGGWFGGASAGVFDLYLNNARSFADTYLGFRPAFVI